MTRLDTCDILLFVNDKSDPIHVFSRWAIGRYEHVAMYMGKLLGVPMVYESRGRGACIASLLPQTGKQVTVMRQLTFHKGGGPLIETACAIAADEKSFYDYFAIVHSVVPRVIAEKLPWLPLPIRYHRDSLLICSEAVAEVFWRNNIMIIPDDEIPLPGDFVFSPYLRYAGGGRLMEEVVP